MANNLVDIAKLLIEMKEERAINEEDGALKSFAAKFNNSIGIKIAKENYIVVSENKVDHNNTKVTIDHEIKYNPSFYFGTEETNEPAIIDSNHNLNILLNEAYSEVCFLKKEVSGNVSLNQDEATKVLKPYLMSVDQNNDFNKSKVIEITDRKGAGLNPYEEIYRCKCIFNDVSENNPSKDLFIKSFSSTTNSNEKSYEVIDDKGIQEEIVKLEDDNDDNNQKTEEIKDDLSVFETRIKEGINKYIQENEGEFYRLSGVDVKAIYLLRLRKIPVEITLINTRGGNNEEVARFETLYPSLNSGNSTELNSFYCPHCNSKLKPEDNMIHVDKDYTDGSLNGIGCTNCMKKCERCGSWHYKIREHNENSKYQLRLERGFLGNIDLESEIEAVDYCKCKEYLTWIKDEMSEITNSTGKFCKNVIGNFLKNTCKLAVVNYLTGEKIADNKDLCLFLDNEFFLDSITRKKYIKTYDDHSLESENNRLKKFFDYVKSYIKPPYDHTINNSMQEFIENCIKKFKKELGSILNVNSKYIKFTSNKNIKKCNKCELEYYSDSDPIAIDQNNYYNYHSNDYFDDVNNQCACCSQASDLKMWVRTEDGVTFYKPNQKSKTYVFYQTLFGEKEYTSWLSSNIKKRIRKDKSTEKEAK